MRILEPRSRSPGACDAQQDAPVQILPAPDASCSRAGIVNIGVRDYDYFIHQTQQIYTRQVRIGNNQPEHLMFDVWEWRKGAEGQQLVNFNTFHVNGEDAKPGEYKTSKFVTTFRALFRDEMLRFLEEAGFKDVRVSKIDGWLWENVYSAQKPK